MDPEVKLSIPNPESSSPNRIETNGSLGELDSGKKTPELNTVVEKTEEKQERLSEVASIMSELPSSVPAPVLKTQDNSDPAGGSIISAAADVSLSADDADLIEKGWIDRAKKIVNDTKDDPHMREDEVSKMQVEYIEKRYGRKIGSAK